MMIFEAAHTIKNGTMWYITYTINLSLLQPSKITVQWSTITLCVQPCSTSYAALQIKSITLINKEDFHYKFHVCRERGKYHKWGNFIIIFVTGGVTKIMMMNCRYTNNLSSRIEYSYSSNSHVSDRNMLHQNLLTKYSAAKEWANFPGRIFGKIRCLKQRAKCWKNRWNLLLNDWNLLYYAWKRLRYFIIE